MTDVEFTVVQAKGRARRAAPAPKITIPARHDQMEFTHLPMEFGKHKISTLIRGVTEIRQQLKPGSFISWKNADEPETVHGSGWYIWTWNKGDLETAKQMLLNAEQKFHEMKSQPKITLYFTMEPEKRKIGAIINKLAGIRAKIGQSVPITWKGPETEECGWHITSTSDSLNLRIKALLLEAEKDWIEGQQEYTVAMEAKKNQTVPDVDDFPPLDESVIEIVEPKAKGVWGATLKIVSAVEKETDEELLEAAQERETKILSLLQNQVQARNEKEREVPDAWDWE